MTPARGRAWVIVLLCAFGAIFYPAAACSDDRDSALGILDKWTCMRWGEDNLAWVVHYPEELVTPWVNSEAERQKMRPEQAEAYRKSFVDELRIGAATAFLISVQSFGPNPLSISPLAKNIALIDSSGTRVSPIAFEKKLDSPISGLVQGFVFFPLQSDGNFRIAINGLLPNRESIFSFDSSAVGVIATAPPPAERVVPSSGKPPSSEVVVKIPTKRPNSGKPSAPSAEPEPEFSVEAEVYAPTEPLPAPQIISDDEDIEPPAAAPLPDAPVKTAKLTSRQALDIYLSAWSAGDFGAMYSLLSTEAQGRISRELFEREVSSGSFRQSLRSGYKVNWVGDTAKVIVSRKILFVRTLDTKQVKFVYEDASARVSW